MPTTAAVARSHDRSSADPRCSRHERAVLRQDCGMTKTSDVTITLTSDEALVLFDLLHRWEDADQVTEPQHNGEQVALWNLSALLERELREPFDARYGHLVTAARGRLS